MTRHPSALLAVTLGVAACGSSPSPELQHARARAAAVLAPPPYSGMTRCDAPPPTSDANVLGFGDDAPTPRVEGSLDKELISRPIRARSTAFRACWLRVLALDPDAEGRVSARFQILGDGSVAWAEIEGFDPRLDACMCDEVLALQFPRFGSARFGPVFVTYPFVFSSQ